MRIAIGQAYNGIHKIYKKHLTNLGVNAFLFNIDKLDWFKIEHKKPDAYIWLADNKEERYHLIHDKIYFIEKILNKPIFPNINMYFAEGHKVRQQQIFEYLKIPTPKTYVAFQKDKALKIINQIKYPFVLKDPYGYGGIHVFKINNQAQAKEYINQIFDSGLKTECSLCKNIFYAQEFLSVDKDLRVITIGPKVFCAYWRQSPTGNWKHNLQQGAQVSFDNIPKQAVKLCEKISKKMKFHWMGYDLLMDNNNPKIIEYSSTVRVKGALQGGYDVYQEQMQYVYKHLKNMGIK